MPGEGLGRGALHRWQDRLLFLLGNDVANRMPVVKEMLRRDAHEAVSYWLQLVVSIGIASLGLVVGSTAVVIGAMLIAPLMVPIVGLAMGLATGSPFLVLRSSGRIVLSVLVAVGGAGCITVLLPFHELNAEISARTTPTVLDLLTAAFCALAGVYASLRPGSDTTSTAAGTSIGISLVPPLCACGYGLGTLSRAVASGAALLFLTNLVAIVAIGTVAFVAAGFNRVDVTGLERDELASGQDAPVARRLARRLAALFESRFGPTLRWTMPFVLLAAVYAPLRSALNEVAWEVKVRRTVQEALEQEPMRVVESRAQVARHAVDVVVVVLGKAIEAEATRARLTEKIARVARVKPSIEVLAVPDATAFAGLESTLLTPRAAPVPLPLAQQLQGSSGRAREAFFEIWPESAAGPALSFSIEPVEGAPPRLHVVHLGTNLEPATRETLQRALSSKLEGRIDLITTALSDQTIRRAPNSNDLEFVSRVAALAEQSLGASPTRLCVTQPALEGKLSEADAQLAEELKRLLARHPRVEMVAGTDFAIQLQRGSCADSAHLAVPGSGGTSPLPASSDSPN